MRRWLSLIVALVALVFVALPAFAGQEELSQVRNSVAKYHHLDKALADGFVPFSINAGEEVTCFDSATGGMGIHYVRNIDDVLDPSDPEALVYEVLPNGKSKLVAVEYIIPSDFVDESNPPSLFGRELHPHAFLKVWILHAWVFSPNPHGMFADFNPRVGQCP